MSGDTCPSSCGFSFLDFDIESSVVVKGCWLVTLHRKRVLLVPSKKIGRTPPIALVPVTFDCGIFHVISMSESLF